MSLAMHDIISEVATGVGRGIKGLTSTASTGQTCPSSLVVIHEPCFQPVDVLDQWYSVRAGYVDSVVDTLFEANFASKVDAALAELEGDDQLPEFDTVEELFEYLDSEE